MMLTIRHEQWSALVDARLGQVAESLEGYLRLHHAAAIQGLDDASLAHRISVGLRRARGWGLDSMFGLGVFVALMFEVGPDFDTDPQIRRLLADHSRKPSDRLLLLDATLTDADWALVAARADLQAWGPVS